MTAFGVETPNENDSFVALVNRMLGNINAHFWAGVALPFCRELAIDADVGDAVEIAWRQWFLYAKGRG